MKRGKDKNREKGNSQKKINQQRGEREKDRGKEKRIEEKGIRIEEKGIYRKEKGKKQR